MKHYLALIAIVFCSVFGVSAQLNTDRLMSVGKNALYFEDFVLSIQYFNQVIRVKPQLIDPYFYRGIAKIQLEDYMGAEADLDVVISRNPFIPMAYYARGFALSHLGRWEDAAMDFSLALQYSPDNVTYTINRVEAFRMGKRYADALADLDVLIARHPSAYDLLFERGIIQLESEDTVAAHSTFRHITEVDSLNPDAWSAYATTAMMLDADTVALAAFDKSVRLGTKNITTYINRGILNYRHHNYRSALADYDSAVEIDSTSRTALFNRALLRYEVGDYNRAVEDLNTVVRLDPNAYEAVYQRAIIHNILGDDAGAIADYTAILNRYPTFVPALYARADIYDRLGRDKEAFADRDRAFVMREEYVANKKAGTDSLSVDVKVSDIDSHSSINDLVRMFNTNPNESVADKYGGSRGAVQNRETELRQEDNINLTYYRPQTDGLPIALYNPMLLQNLNSGGVFSAPLYLVSQDTRLSASMVSHHFRMVNSISEAIVKDADNPLLYMARAINYATIQDFDNAIADLSKSVILDPENAMAFFCRANIRFRQMEVKSNDMLDTRKDGASATYQMSTPVGASSKNIDYHNTYELIMRDYDYAISLAPEFAFSWYNRANLLVLQQDYNTAIDNYTRAIAIEPRLAEAYFNRGLTYILVADKDKAIKDLSKAGELGIYRAYSIIKRLQMQQ